MIECVIALGHYLFYNSAMISAVMICKAHKPDERKNKVLFIEAENEVTRKNAQSYLEPVHIERMVNAYNSFTNEPGYCQVASKEEILANNGKLSISLYVEGVPDEDIETPEEAFESWSKSAESFGKDIVKLEGLL